VLELTIISPIPIAVNSMTAALSRLTGSWVLQGTERAVLQSGSAHVSINTHPSLGDEWEEQDLRSIQVLIRQPSFLLMEGNNRELMERVIASLAELVPGALVDNDRGLREPLATFAARVNDDPSWNWHEAIAPP